MVFDTPWHKQGLKYNLFAVHTIWNYEKISSIMGRNGVYFSILRDPAELYISLWNYFRFGKQLQLLIK